jgi:transcriptional regulator with XRE-family HTH domain
VEDQRLSALIRSVRLRRSMRQQDLAQLAGVSQATISLVERGHFRKLSIETLRRIAGPLDIRVDVLGRWRGGDGDRLLSRAHSLLANQVSAMLGDAGWVVHPEVSFSIYGERGVIDLLAWHSATRHLLVIELKTAFVDVNEMLGTLDRKARLARKVAAERGLTPDQVSVWLIVSESRTNRRHARQHASLLESRFTLDGRSLKPFLRRPRTATSGLAFWPDSSGGVARHGGTVPESR